MRNDCNAIYIGQTGRSFNTRIKEHIACWRNQKTEVSNFSDHLLNNNHSFNPKSNIKILHTNSKSKKLNTLENLEIKKSLINQENLVNVIINICNSPLLDNLQTRD